MAKIGRNDPCPCGSGKKYKKCHLGDERAPGDAGSEGMPAAKTLGDRLNAGLVEALRLFAMKRFGEDWFREAADLFDIGTEAELELMVPWSYFHFRVKGVDTIADIFLRERGERLSPDDREWLASQQGAWLSIWSVLEVIPGLQMVMEDALTGERRTVYERTATRTLVRHDAVLARVTDFRGVSTLTGIFPRAIPPRSTKTLLAEVRKVLRKAKIETSPAALRLEPGTLVLVRLCQQLLDALEKQPPPQLCNTDGDPFLFTKDRFRYETKNRDAVEAALRGLPDAQAEEDGRIVLTRPGNAMQKSWENTIIGSAAMADGRLVVETNSIRRADALRARIESACGAMLVHLSRDHSDPQALLDTAAAGGMKRPPPAQSAEERAELDRIGREMRDRMNREWLDLEVPALGGKTPREAARSPTLRKELLLLLDEFEHREARTPIERRIDVSWMRTELGLDAPRARTRKRLPKPRDE